MAQGPYNNAKGQALPSFFIDKPWAIPEHVSRGHLFSSFDRCYDSYSYEARCDNCGAKLVIPDVAVRVLNPPVVISNALRSIPACDQHTSMIARWLTHLLAEQGPLLADHVEILARDLGPHSPQRVRIVAEELGFRIGYILTLPPDHPLSKDVHHPTHPRWASLGSWLHGQLPISGEEPSANRRSPGRDADAGRPLPAPKPGSSPEHAAHPEPQPKATGRGRGVRDVLRRIASA